ncbi:MAG: hypothetical protein AAF726_07690 [Planctomycetota bacterium]
MAKKKARRATKKKATRKTTARKKKASKKRGAVDMIISKSRTKALASINVSGDFYGALDEKVREMIAGAEDRAMANNRRTLRPQDL